MIFMKNQLEFGLFDQIWIKFFFISKVDSIGIIIWLIK